MGGISIFSAKELAQTYQPLLLCEFEFVDGTFLRISTHALAAGYNTSPASGSYQYGGVPWYPRVINQNISATQAMSDLGVDMVPQVQVNIADADKSIYSGYEIAKGFKGAVLRIYSTMWDVGNLATGSFSSDSPAPIKFIGTCSAAMAINQKTITVMATSLLNLTQQQMPPIRIQPLCPWTFPPTASARADGKANGDSPYYQCGYSPDVSGGVGNMDGTGYFTSCDLAFASCVDRLGNSTASIPIIQDESNRATGRFGGQNYVPVQNNGLQRSYITGQWELIINATNEARYGDYIPLCYGMTWVQPEVMGVYGDGNYTRFEGLLCFNSVQSLQLLVVNGDVVPQLNVDSTDRPNNYIPSPSTTSDYKDNYWTSVNNGGRNGLTDSATGWNNQGDPFGSMATINVQVLAQLAASSSLPQVQALIQAGYIRVYTSPTAFTYQYSTNPAWILLDLMVQANWRYTDINIASFVAAAAVCDTQIYFNRLDGTYANVYNESDSPDYLRYSVGFTIKQRASMGEVIRGVRNAMRGLLFFDFSSGLLTIQCKQTIADQQPNPITGSNYSTLVPSVTAAGVSQSGYVAYSFDGGSIMKDDNGMSTLKVSQSQYAETPNKATNYFFDRENQWSQDISTIIDVEDVNRIGAEVVGTFNLIGPNTFDHINRVTATWFAENYRGNPRLDYEGSAIGDTGGTIVFDFQTSVKAIHLMVGQICLVSDAQNGITMQPVRISRIQPSQNFETAMITARWHNDNWYQDTYGQGANQPIYKNPMSGADTNPRAWMPNYEVPQTGDAYNDPTDKGFGIGQMYTNQADGTPIAQIQIAGQLPVNAFPSLSLTPQLELVGIGDTGGDYPSGTSYFVGLSALAADGSISPLSNLCVIQLGPSQDALDFVVQGWPPNSVGYYAFAGLNPNQMSLQSSASVTASVLNLSNTFQVGDWGAPDQAFNGFEWLVATEAHAGPVGAGIYSVTTNSIKLGVFVNYGFTTNQWAGREVVVLGVQIDDPSLPTFNPIANFPIASNDADTLYLSAGDPTTCVYGESLQPGDAVAIRLLPTFGKDSIGNYFEDLQLINCLNAVGPAYAVTNATNTSPVVISLTIAGVFPFNIGDTVVVQGVQGNTGANGGFTATAVDPIGWTVTLGGSTGTGAYTMDGVAYQQIPGLSPNAEIGLVAFVIAGTGKGTSVKIASNTPTRWYISGEWPVTPDETTRIILINSVFTIDTTSIGISNSIVEQPSTHNIDVTNFGRQTLFVAVGTVSIGGLPSLKVYNRFREIFMFGSQGTRTVFASDTMIATDRIILVDATAGDVVFTMLPFYSIPNQSLFVQKTDSSVNTVTIVVNPVPGTDLINGNSSVMLSNQWDGVNITVGG